jgi:hypothetical protein
MGSILNIEGVIGDPRVLGLSASEIEDVLAVAYLAMRADRKLTEEELDTFDRAVAAMLGAGEDRTAALMDKFALQCSTRGLDAMLVQVASRLRRDEARRQAYKLSYAMSLSDLDTNDDEFLFEDKVRAALGLPEETAEELMDEVIVAIEGSGGHEEEN